MEELRINILGCGWLGLPLACSWIQAGTRVYGSPTSLDKMRDFKALGIRTFLIDFSYGEGNVVKGFVQGSKWVVSVSNPLPGK